MKKYSLLIGALLIITSCASQLNIYDGFETHKIGPIWSTDRMVKDAIQFQSAIVRKGHSAVKITLKTGDIYESGSGKSPDTERDELREANNLVSIEDKFYEYKFSLFLPDSFPIVPVRLVIAQWKQKCPDDSSCSDDSPVMAVRYISGKLFVTIRNDSTTKTVYETKDEVRNKWLDFTFKVRFSRLNNGEVNAWLNENKIINYRGITAYTSKKGYHDKSYFYFKTGLYRDRMSLPMTIYVDEYRKQIIPD